MPSLRPSATGEGENTKNGNLAVTVLRLPSVIVQRKRRQLQVPAYRR